MEKSEALRVTFGELRPGALYALEFKQRLTARNLEQVRESLKPFTDEFGVKFLILDSGVTIAKVGEPPEAE